VALGMPTLNDVEDPLSPLDLISGPLVKDLVDSRVWLIAVDQVTVEGGLKVVEQMLQSLVVRLQHFLLTKNVSRTKRKMRGGWFRLNVVARGSPAGG